MFLDASAMIAILGSESLERATVVEHGHCQRLEAALASGGERSGDDLLRNLELHWVLLTRGLADAGPPRHPR